MELRTVNNKINKKYPGLLLVKGSGSKREGYFFFTSDDKELGTKLAGLYTTSVYVNRVGGLSVDRWIEEADLVMKQIESREGQIFDNGKTPLQETLRYDFLMKLKKLPATSITRAGIRQLLNTPGGLDLIIKDLKDQIAGNNIVSVDEAIGFEAYELLKQIK